MVKAIKIINLRLLTLYAYILVYTRAKELAFIILVLLRLTINSLFSLLLTRYIAL